MRYVYEAIFEPDGKYMGVEFPDIPGCHSFGEGLDEAVSMGADALETMLSYLIEEGKPLPASTFGRSAPKGGAVMAISVSAPVAEPEAMSVADAAMLLGVSPRRVNAMIGEGILTATKAGRENLVTVASVQQRLSKPRRAGRPRAALQKV